MSYIIYQPETETTETICSDLWRSLYDEPFLTYPCDFTKIKPLLFVLDLHILWNTEWKPYFPHTMNTELALYDEPFPNYDIWQKVYYKDQLDLSWPAIKGSNTDPLVHLPSTSISGLFQYLPRKTVVKAMSHALRNPRCHCSFSN